MVFCNSFLPQRRKGTKFFNAFIHNKFLPQRRKGTKFFNAFIHNEFLPQRRKGTKFFKFNFWHKVAKSRNLIALHSLVPLRLCGQFAFPYSVLKLFIGLANAAFMLWKLTVANAIITAKPADNTNNHQCSDIR